MELRPYQDFSSPRNELLKNQTFEALGLSNKIISDEVEELVEQISQIIQK